MKNWFRNAVIYEIDVENFKDANGDGIGDFQGLYNSLAYLEGLNVDCLWLLPIYKTPNRDNGYDVCDYYQIDPRLGDFSDFAYCLERAEQLGLNVLIDLPVNHTSVDHPWFRQARSDPDSPYRDFYVWCDEPPQDAEEKIIFGDQQSGNWEWCEEAGQYYYHTFYAHEADLNFANPTVRHEIQKIMHFWMRQGISGFRLDAVPHMLRPKGNERFETNPHEHIVELHQFVRDENPDAVFMAEVDVEPERYADYIGEGEHRPEIDLLLNFYACNYLWLAMAREEASPIAHAYAALPNIHECAQWATFLRNHDELDLERLNQVEFDETIETFAPDDEMRIFGRGIRRRVAPMLGGDRRRIELAYSLMLTLPGTPIFRYGQELPMGEDLSREGREAVRTAMQWSREKNGGFSSADPDELVRPVIDEGPFGYHEVNVTDDRRDPNSLLNWLARAISIRKDMPEFGRGRHEFMDTGDARVLAHRCHVEHRFGLAVQNLCGEEVEITLDLTEDEADNLLDVFGDCAYEPFDPDEPVIRLHPYGYRWFRRSMFSEEGKKGERP